MYYDIVDETSDSNKGEETTCREVYIPPPPPDDELFIISPTRELTLQIYNEARKFIYNSLYRPVAIYGGTSVGHQLRQLEVGCNI